MLSAHLSDVLAEYLPSDAPPFALAYSGGGDSLALLSLLRDHPSLKAVLHVDHGLREESAQDAVRAAENAKSLGHEATILHWTTDSPMSGLQEKARQARYGLMGDYCRKTGIETLVTAHHADDQAETVLMRVQRASGWRGAAGMRVERYAPVWPELAGVTLFRPALGVSREDLRTGLGDLTPVEDRSNQDEGYARVRARRELAGKPDLRADMLALSADMQQGLEADMARIRHDLSGYHLTHEGLMSVPRLIHETSLALVAPIIGGQSGPADRQRMAEKLPDIASGRTVSIGEGCMAQWDGEILTLMRDPVAITGRKDRRLAPTAVAMAVGGDPFVWDGRFLVSGDAGQIHPERRVAHVGYRVLYGRGVRVDNLVKTRLNAALTLS